MEKEHSRLPLAAFCLDSPLLGLEKTATGYSGWYAPAKAGEWRVTLHLPQQERDRFDRLWVNGQEQPVSRGEDGSLQWTGTSAPGSPLRWAQSRGD